MNMNSFNNSPSKLSTSEMLALAELKKKVKSLEEEKNFM